MIIGLCGHKRAGKNLAARFFIKHSKINFIERSFAYNLKKIASILTGLDCQSEKFKDLFLEEWGMTGRKFLQKLGTDAIRKKFHKKTWILSLFHKYEESNHADWIITDVRSYNEIEEIKKHGGIIVKVLRPCKEPEDTFLNFIRMLFQIGEQFHRSETELDDYKPDYFLIANNAEELEYRVRILCGILKINK